MSASLHIQDAQLRFGDKVVFSHINMTLAPQRMVALLGPSGAGKSSLLRFIAGILNSGEQQGRVFLSNGHPHTTQITYMAQQDLLMPWLTVRDNALLDSRLRMRQPSTATLDQLNSLLQQVALQDAAHLYPHELSGGMRQRVALVRTLMADKPIVLMDEPFSACDAITRHKLQALAARLLIDKTVLFITHDPLEALRLAQEIYILHGNPACLSVGPTLHTDAPRALSNAELQHWQPLLYTQLCQAGDSPC